MSKQVGNVVLLGNSLNLLENQGKSWECIVNTCEASIEDLEAEKKRCIQNMPLVFRMSRFFNNWQFNIRSNKSEKGNDNDRNVEDNENKYSQHFKEMCEGIRELSPGNMHMKLMEVIKDCEIITTNYDYVIEKLIDKEFALNEEIEVSSYEELMYKREFAILNNMMRHHGRVWHIHGEAGVPESVVIDSDGYAKGLATLKYHGHYKGTWLNLFLSQSVHILGLELRASESLLWFALQARLEIPPSERKPVYYYHFVHKEDKAAESFAVGLKEMLRAYDVVYCGFKVTKDNYQAAWIKVLKKLKKNMKHLPCNDFPPFRTSYPAFNIVSSSSPTSNNQARCWMNIGIDKLERFADNDKWLFDCRIEGKRYVYCANIGELKKKFDEHKVSIMENKPERFSFYIDYKRGKIYTTVSDTTSECVLELEKITERAKYKSYMKHKGKECKSKKKRSSCAGDKRKKSSPFSAQKVQMGKTSPSPDKSYPTKPIDMKVQKSNQYPPYHAYSSCNIVTSAKPTATNPSRCWMNIEVEKLESFANEDMWIFDTNVQNVRRVYYIEISTLKAAFEQRYLTKMTKGTVRYSFYMDYAEGILYTAAPSTTGEYILTLKNLPDGETYRNFMRRLPK